MSDYIHFMLPTDKFIYARRLVAFFPCEGYAIFEGYSHLKKEDLPYEVTIDRYQPGINASGQFVVQVTGIFKKDLWRPVKKDKEPHYCDPDECGCSISFFPCDIIILRFQVLKAYDSNYTWDFCVDNRFLNTRDLINAYLGLQDLPADMYAEYESREEDASFYEGYHIVMDNNDDIYKGQYAQ
jgi:hypothetical protein